MTTLPFQQSDEVQRLLYGWGLSLLVHGLVAASVFVLVSDLRPVPEPEPFRWEVALVEAPKTAEPETAAEAPPDPAPLTAPRPLQTQPPVQTAQPIRTIEPVQAVKPVEQIVREHVRQEVVPVQPVAQGEIRSVSSVEESQPVQTAPVHQQRVAREQETDPVLASVVQTEPARPVMKPLVTTAAPVRRSEPSVVPEPAVEAVPSAPVIQATAQERPAPEASAQPTPALVERAPINQQVAQQVPQQATQQVAMAQPAAKTDFGWLGEALWHRVLQLKRYPPEARMRGLEGRVVLRVVIREDGHLQDLRVLQSSGHDVLDQDAVQIVRRACPLKLKHPLGRPQVAVLVPINYHLER